MACPMRFVLAGISALLACFLVWRNASKQDDDKSGGRGWYVFGDKSWGRILLDFFTGRFLLDMYKMHAGSSTLHEKSI